MMARRPTATEAAAPSGDMLAPPFVRLPDPALLFDRRAERFRAVAVGHELGPYLRFLGDIAEAQGRMVEPVADRVAVGIRPLDRTRVAVDAACIAALREMITGMRDTAVPPAARNALTRLGGASEAEQRDLLRATLDEPTPTKASAEYGFVAAALQTVFVRRASRLDAMQLQPMPDGTCPVCASPPVASLVVGWESARGTRYLACALCSTLWNYVRIKCSLCGSTGGIAYQGIDGDPGLIKAETCESCHHYVKLMQQNHEPAMDPVADDVASLALDLLMRQTPFFRGASNPFLLGY
jgi:FdhE protein